MIHPQRQRRNEEKLQTTMDSVREFQDMAECQLFQNSFRLGARMMLEILEER